MILTSNKKHLRANIFFFEIMYKKKRQLNKCFLHAIRKRDKNFCIFQRVAFSDNSQTFEKKSVGKTFYFTKNNLKVTLLVLCYQENIKLMLYEKQRWREEVFFFFFPEHVTLCSSKSENE